MSLGESPLGSRPLATEWAVIATNIYDVVLSTTSTVSAIITRVINKVLTAVINSNDTPSVSNKTTGTYTGTSSSFTTTAISTTSGKAYLLSIAVYDGFGLATSISSISTGSGITWTKLTSVQKNGISDFLDLWYGVASSSSGSASWTVTYNTAPVGGQSTCYLIDEISNVDAAVFAQYASSGADSSSPISTTLSAFANGTNIPYAVCAGASAAASPTITEEAGWTSVATTSVGSTYRETIRSAYSSSQDTTPSFTFSGTAVYTAMIALELKGSTSSRPVQSTNSIIRNPSKSLTTTLSNATTFIKSINKRLTATSSSVSAIIKSAAKSLTTTVSNSTSLVKSVAKLISSTSSNVADIIATLVNNGTNFPLALTASSTAVLSFYKQVSKLLSQTSTNTSAINRFIGKSLSTNVNHTQTIVKVANKLLSASSTTTSTITRAIAKTLALSSLAVLTFTKVIAKLLTQTVSNSTTIQKAVSKVLPLLNSVANSSIVKSANKVLAATSSNVSSIVKSIAKVLSATSSSVKTFTKGASKSLSATSTNTATLIKSIAKLLSTSVTNSTFFNAIKTVVLNLVASASNSVVLTKITNKTLNVVNTILPTLFKNVSKYGQIVVNSALIFSKQINKTLMYYAKGGSQNLHKYSEIITSSNYSFQNCTTTANAATDPLGGNNAYLASLTAGTIYDANNGSGINTVVNPYTKTSGATITLSCYAKAGPGITSVMFRNNWTGGNPIFNLSTGTITQNGSGVSSIQSVGNGWYRCINTYVLPNSVGNGISIRPYLSGGTSNGTDGCYVWGVQVEFSTVSPYVTTTNDPVFGISILTKSVVKTLFQISNVTTSISKNVSKFLNLLSSSTTSIVKNILKPLNTVVNNSSYLLFLNVLSLLLSTTATASTGLTRITSKALNTTVNKLSTLLKNATKSLATSENTSVTLLRGIGKSIVTTITSSPTLSKLIRKDLIGTSTAIASFAHALAVIIYNLLVSAKNWAYYRKHKLETTVRINEANLTNVHVAEPIYASTEVQLTEQVNTTVQINNQTNTIVQIQ